MQRRSAPFGGPRLLFSRLSGLVKGDAAPLCGRGSGTGITLGPFQPEGNRFQGIQRCCPEEGYSKEKLQCQRSKPTKVQRSGFT
jgi:hypothetical protein